MKTVKEISTGRNVKSVDLKNFTTKENKELIKKVEQGNLPGYHTV